MQRTLVLTAAVAVFAACAVTAQGPPAAPPTMPPATNSVPPIDTPPVVQGPPATQQPPPVQSPPATPPAQEPPPVDAPVPAVAPMLSELTREELRQRRQAIFLMEGVLANAVKLGAQYTASEIQRVQPGIMMFSAGPVKALGTYLEGYGVFFQVEIPSVIPSVASLLETLGRDRLRPNAGAPAQPTTLSGGSSPEALMNPDAHYVESVKSQLVNAMVRLSHSLELRPNEWLTVSARDGSESPGQLTEPSTMILRIKGADLADFFAGRISLDEARRRVQVRGF